jgi:hypothetical protein
VRKAAHRNDLAEADADIVMVNAADKLSNSRAIRTDIEFGRICALCLSPVLGCASLSERVLTESRRHAARAASVEPSGVRWRQAMSACRAERRPR